MHERQDRERWDDDDPRRSIRIPGPELGRPVVVAPRDSWTRIEVTAGLFIAVCEQGAPTPLAARARFTPPVDVDELVNAVAMLGRRNCQPS